MSTERGGFQLDSRYRVEETYEILITPSVRNGKKVWSYQVARPLTDQPRVCVGAAPTFEDAVMMAGSAAVAYFVTDGGRREPNA